jgi:Meckel syndrome type 1 protein
MTSGDNKLERELESFLADDSRVAALYRRLPKDEPDAKLDAAILAQARAAVATRRSRPRWMPAMSAAAALVVVAGLAYRLGPHVWNERSAVSENAEQTVAAPASPAPTNEPQQSAETAGAAASRATPAPVPQPTRVERERSTSEEKTRGELGKVERPKTPAAAFATQSTPAKKLESADKQSARDSVDAATANSNVLQSQSAARMKSVAPAPRLDAVPAAAPQPVGKPNAFPGTPASAAYSPPPAPPSAAMAPAREMAKPSAADVEANSYPEHWIVDIRQMLEDGRRDDAIKNLAAFRKRYPDYKLPDDLRDLK